MTNGTVKNLFVDRYRLLQAIKAKCDPNMEFNR
jgi:hypothetical protein